MNHVTRAPVVMIIFNRPDNAQRVFDVIREVKPRNLFVIADGPRASHPTDKERCEETRAIIEQVDWECEVVRNFSESNLGCGKRISSGLAWVFRQVDEAIILEDDCVPDVSFFKYCEQLLGEYRNDERVCMISGTSYINSNNCERDSYFFSKHYAIWGWATWKRAWEHYDFGMSDWRVQFSEDDLNEKCLDSIMSSAYAKMFDWIKTDITVTWDIQWAYSCIKNNMLSIVPADNLVMNIGVAGAHSNTRSNSHFRPTGVISFPMNHPAIVESNREYDNYIFHTLLKDSLGGRIQRFIKKGLLATPFFGNAMFRILKKAKNVV